MSELTKAFFTMWTTYLLSREARELCSIYFKLTVTVLLVLQFAIVETKGKAINSYKWRGELCSKNSDCDQSMFFKCVGGLCDCQQESGQIWVPRENMCMIMEGMTCADGSGLMCVYNSSCISGICECDMDFLRNGEGLCDLSYGVLCNPDDQLCAKRYLLQCPQQADSNRKPTCECQGEGVEYVWDENKRKCVSTAGGFCDIWNNSGYGKDDQLECIRNAECTSSGRCECMSGFAQTHNGDCLLKYGEKCNNSDGYVCNTNEFLICQDGLCACEFYGQMVYDKNVKQCRWLVGEDCEIPKTSEQNDSNHETVSTYRRCVEDSYCEPRSNSHNRGTCVCKSGLVKSTDNTCTKLRRHGHKCSASMDCDTKLFLECALALNDNEDSHCECHQNSMYFDGKQCRVYPGKNCQENKHCAPNSYCEGDWCVCNQEYQIDGLECVSRQKISRNDQNLEIRKKTTMYPMEENSSTSSDISPIQNNCSGQAFLSPDWNMCMCQMHTKSHLWSPVLQKCLGLVCTNCITNNDCVVNAVCNVDTLTCQCLESAQPTRNRTCELVTKSLRDHLMYQYDCTEKMHALKSIAALDKPDFQSNQASTILSFRCYSIWLPQALLLLITQHYCSVFTKLFSIF